MRGSEWLLGLVLLRVGWPGMAAGGEPDSEAVRRLMEKYEREAAEEAVKPASAIDYDHEAWKAATECGTAACFRVYLEDYPKGRYAKMAEARLESESESKPQPTAAVSNDIDRPRPDPGWVREELEKYSLGSLKMMGTVPMGGKLWALVLAPDNVVHRMGKKITWALTMARSSVLPSSRSN